MTPRGDLQVALVGYGYAGRTFHAPLIGATPDLRLALVASGDAGKVHAELPGVEVVGDPRAAIDDPRIDLVVLGTPNATHAPLARAALEAGKHVVVDKPFALTLAEARDVAALAQARGLRLSVFHNRRWDADFLGLRQAIGDGVIGEVVHFEAHFDRFRPQVRDRWRERDVPGGGIWFDLGPHLIDQALQLLGLPDRVSGHLATQRDGAVTSDWAHAVLEFGARRAVLHAGMLVAGGVPRFTVHGTRGSLVKHGLDPQEAQLVAGMRPGAVGWGVDDAPLLVFDGSDAEPHRLSLPAGDQGRFYAGLRDAIRGVGADPVPPVEALAVMAVLEAATASAAHGMALPLPLTRDERRAFAGGDP